MRAHTTTSLRSGGVLTVTAACAAVALLTAGPAAADATPDATGAAVATGAVPVGTLPTSAVPVASLPIASLPIGAVPPPGTVLTLAEHATSVVIACGNVAYPFELFGSGQRLVGLATVDKGTTHVPLTTVAEDLTGSSPDFGHISATETSPAVGELTKTDAGPASPVTYADTAPMNLSITIDHDPCDAGASPETLVTAKTAQLRDGALAAFPPRGGNDFYQLQDAVDLAPAGSPSRVVAQLLQFPVAVVQYP